MAEAPGVERPKSRKGRGGKLSLSYWDVADGAACALSPCEELIDEKRRFRAFANRRRKDARPLAKKKTRAEGFELHCSVISLLHRPLWKSTCHSSILLCGSIARSGES
jgi:hypothetical protein